MAGFDGALSPPFPTVWTRIANRQLVGTGPVNVVPDTLPARTPRTPGGGSPSSPMGGKKTS
jgi:hypothetical protein